MRVTVAVDCMGGDHGPSVTVPAALALLHDDPDAGVILTGLAADIEAQLKRLRSSPSAFGAAVWEVIADLAMENPAARRVHGLRGVAQGVPDGESDEHPPHPTG